MRTQNMLAVIALLAIIAGGAAVANAALPDNQQIAYYIRESPADPNSAIAVEVDLTLSAQAADTNSVGWRIDKITFHRTVGGVKTTWTKSTPAVNTPDGLWWVQHANVTAPQKGEFAEPPPLNGTASAKLAQDPNLDFSWSSAAPPAPSSTPYANAAALTYVLELVSEAGPLVEGDDEPVEIDDPQTGNAP
jgi:uncharacterized protein with beta-barrel porin domain